ncbi:MAG: mechanosensitive ion channel [Chlorobium phaeobacteroides]|jgi:small-conductance mechanosensitive channel|nr:mechanosensitive ion channel [Chlorobium phaeobacteroides]
MNAAFWESLSQVSIIPVFIVAFAVVLFFTAKTLLRGVFARLRSSIRESGVPFELMVLPFRLLAVLIALAAVLHELQLSLNVREYLEHAHQIASIIAVAWFFMRLFSVFEQFTLQRYPLNVRDNVSARKVATNVSLLRKILNVLLVVVAVSSVLMTFETVRQIGLSILASAGVAGVILGFAAQKSIATLIAGIQIALTQPIRVDDIVVVEKEGGRIEEISLTYVVVRLWDQRRLIVPITWFIDRPFENWTRSSAELLGTVFFYADYAIPIDILRQELERIVRSSSLWDGRVVKMHVTNATEKVVEIRALISAANSSDSFELRCFVREQLIEFIRINYPGGLPKESLAEENGALPGGEGKDMQG